MAPQVNFAISAHAQCVIHNGAIRHRGRIQKLLTVILLLLSQNGSGQGVVGFAVSSRIVNQSLGFFGIISHGDVYSGEFGLPQLKVGVWV